VSPNEPKKKGGPRAGAGRKKNGARVAVEAAVAASPDLDGRAVGGKDHARALIDDLNSIEPEMMEHLALHVSPEPLEIPEDADEKRRAEIRKQEALRRVAWKLRERAQRKFSRLSFELQGWARIWFNHDTRIKLEARKYLYDKAGHQAVRVINHVHDKPIEMNVNLSMAEIVREVRERKQAYERSRA
jgi:hypothetical protein